MSALFILREFLLTFVQIMGLVLYALILVRVVLSWVRLPLPLGLQRWVFDVTEPMLAPLRRVLPTAAMGLDLSPFIAIVLIGLVQQVLDKIVRGILPGPL